MHKGLERALDNGNIVIVQVDPTKRPIHRWKIILVNESARNQFLEMNRTNITKTRRTSAENADKPTA